MQNRFKFRHFNLLTKKMTYYDKPEMQVCLSDDFKSGLIFPLSEEYDDNAMYMGNYTYYQQCTGLKDKNGKLIFEGDICIYDFEEIGKQKAVIYFDITYAGFMVKPLRNFQCTKLNNCEIIGNIYENQELLEVKGE